MADEISEVYMNASTGSIRDLNRNTARTANGIRLAGAAAFMAGLNNIIFLAKDYDLMAWERDMHTRTNSRLRDQVKTRIREKAQEYHALLTDVENERHPKKQLILAPQEIKKRKG